MRGLGVRKVAAVFGGAGFVGRYVVQRLAHRDFVVRVGTRDPVGARFLATQGRVGQIVPLAADIRDEGAVARAVAEADLVVNLVGILFERRSGDFARIHVEGAERVARLSAAAGVSRLVHVSAIGADPRSESLYARTKGEGEEAVHKACPGATILRPSLIFGPEDGLFNRFGAMAQWLPVMPVIRGGTRFQPVYVGDVADAIVAAADREDAIGRTYELGGPRVMTMRELLRFVLETTRRRRPLVDVPDGVARLLAWFGEKLPNPPLTRDQLLLLGKDNVVAEGAPGLRELGVTAPKAVEAVVPGYLARFRPGGQRADLVAAI